LPDERSVALEIYAQGRRHQLLIGTHPQHARLHLTEQKPRRGVEKETPLLLLLRKYVRDAQLAAIVQPDPYERVVQLRFDHREHGPTTLVAELMGRLSNVILLNRTGMILEALVRVAPGGTARPVRPGLVYRPPPRTPRLPPLDDGTPDFYARLAALLSGEGPLWKALANGVDGLSPTAARVVATLATGDAQAATSPAALVGVIAALQTLWGGVMSGQWQPVLLYGEPEKQQLVGCAPYLPPNTAHWEAAPSMNEAVARVAAAREWAEGDAPAQRHAAAGSAPSPADGYAAQRAAVAALIKRARSRVARQQQAAHGDLPAPGEVERLRLEGDWLLAAATEITTEQRELVIEWEEQPLCIQLEPGVSAVEQAQRRYAQAGKLVRAAAIVPARLAHLERDADFLAQLAADLQRAASQPEIAALRALLDESGLTGTVQQAQPPAKRGGSGKPLRFRNSAGFEILVGRNARQNDQLTFETAHADDTWLHVRGQPGAHVVVRHAGRRPDRETLVAAAQLAAFHSTVRGETAAEVIYTVRRHVKRLADGRPGQVTVRHEQVLTVRAEMPSGVILLA
jgi:predicted ribosome quality control (RQC) complex YloA/Tae2 family protein